MEKSSKRGKIPQQDWPSIIARYEAGETLASIARTYDCSPPAISYIVSRTKARNAAAVSAADPAPTAAEPQLLKGPSEASTNNIAAGDLSHGEPATSAAASLEVPVSEPRLIEQPANPPQPLEPRLFADDPPQRPNPPANPMPSANPTPSMNPARPANPTSSEGAGPILRYGHAQRDETSPAGNGSAPRGSGAAGGPPHNGDSRRTLHLSLPHGNGGPHGSDSLPHNAPNAASSGSGERFSPHPAGPQSALGQPSRQGPPGHYPPSGSPAVPPRGSAAPFRPPGDIYPGTPNRPPGEGQRGKDGGAFIDQTLRERVAGDVAAFLAAFDAALDHDTSESRTELREATDRLLRAGARTRIELERLEARAPLPARDKIGQSVPIFRHR